MDRMFCLKFLDIYIESHGVPPFIRLDQTKCLVGHEVKNICNKNYIAIIEAPVNDHRSFGSVATRGVIPM